MINSRQKGARGERLWRDELRANGYDARRGQQFSGSPDSPDVVCPALEQFHFEVKCVEKLNLQDAVEQARRDCGAKTPIVAHKRNHCGFLVTMESETFFKLLRGDYDNSGITRDNRKNESVAVQSAGDRAADISTSLRSEGKGKDENGQV